MSWFALVLVQNNKVRMGYGVLDRVDVTRLAQLIDAGTSNNECARRLGVSPKTVRRWKDRLAACNNDPKAVRMGRRPGSGAPPQSIAAVNRRRHRRDQVGKLADKTRHIDSWTLVEFPSCAAIRDELARLNTFDVSKSTIWRDLKLGFVNRVRPKAPTKRHGDMAARVKLLNQLQDPELCCWTDEAYPGCNQQGQVRTQWCRKNGQVFAPPSLREVLRWPVRVGVFGGIWIGGRHLKFLPRAPPQKKGKPGRPRKVKRGRPRKNPTPVKTDPMIDQSMYLKHCVKPLIAKLKKLPGARLVWQQDGATAHWAHSVVNWIEGQGFKILKPWPAHSPDLNPIEEIWGLVGRRVARRHHPRTQKELEKAFRIEWWSLPQSHIDNTIRRWRRKRQAVLAVGGAYVKVGRAKGRKDAKKSKK